MSETDVAKETGAKNKGFSKLFKAFKTNLTTQNTDETRPVRDRVAFKLTKRRRMYEGCSRDQITADIRQKYFKE